MDNKEMTLHFDLSLGCTAGSLIGALADLCTDIECVKRALAACGLPSDEVHIETQARKFSRIACLELPSLTNHSFRDLPLPKRSAKHRPAWAQTPKNTNKQGPERPSDEHSDQWLKDEPVTLHEIRARLAQSALSPIPQALALKVIDLLIAAREKVTGLKEEASPLTGTEATRVLYETVAFCELITSLNLAQVTATRVAMSTPPELPGHVQSWIFTLAEDIPTLDRSWPAPYSDHLGLALIKAIVTRFGTRGDSVIERHGIGGESTASQNLVTTRALLCHPSVISSRPDESGLMKEAMPQVEITATLGHGIDLNDLLRRLSGFGMKSVSTWQTFQGSTFPRVMLRGLAPYGEVQTAIEALLITGEASELSTHHVETQSLQQRTVSVPFGRGQKMQACRVNEWLWCGKILRADPDPSDLSLLVHATGFAQDVVRADVLAAWRKWRHAS